jgi:hypothetical protein
MVQKPHYAFVIDIARCIDCRACQVACSVENRVPLSNTRIWVQDLGVQGSYPNLERTFVPYNCMHCDNPPTEVCEQPTYKDKKPAGAGTRKHAWLRLLRGCLPMTWPPGQERVVDKCAPAAAHRARSAVGPAWLPASVI